MTPVAVDPLQPQVAARRAPVSHVHPPPPAGYGSLPPETPREGGDGPAAPSARLGARRANPCPPTWMPAAAARPPPPPHRGRRRPSAPRRPAPPDMAALRRRPGRGARARRRSGPPAPRMRLRRGRRRQRPGGPGGCGGRRQREPSGDRAGTGGRVVAASERASGRAGARFSTARSGVSRGFNLPFLLLLFFFFLLKRGCVFSPFPSLGGFCFYFSFGEHPRPLPFPRSTAAGSRQPLGDESQPLLSRAWQPPPALAGDRRHASSLPSEKKMSTLIFNDEYLTLSAHCLSHAPHKSYFPIQVPISPYTTFQPQFSKRFTWQRHHFPTSDVEATSPCCMRQQCRWNPSPRPESWSGKCAPPNFVTIEYLAG